MDFLERFVSRATKLTYETIGTRHNLEVIGPRFPLLDQPTGKQ
jgi:hypothetical protein